ncbi:hypothetical protein AOC36_05570 [Erysipelothrix larvae]|uniref:DUF2179 domain-containing protein n=1 Tax=Erysipelothrix larvae TaxID=1514105 RepID=A0A120JTN8_9FIRM|nr:YitT family protein [Erysipelothrix larvae]AMC93465.1 hypothetical protein AOC36_05570 [Erysipelothrix larvae]
MTKHKLIPSISSTNIVGIVLSSLMSSFAIVNFVRPAHLVPAGVTGLSMLVQREVLELLNVNLSFGVIYLFINVSILLFVFKHLGKQFVILSLLHVVLTSFFSDILPVYQLAHEPVLLAIFGGVVNGLAISVALKVGGSTGGTDFIAIFFSTVKNRPMWDKIMIFNMSMLIYNGWRSNWELSLYSIIYQFISTEILTKNHDRYKLSSLHIITDQPEVVSQAILSIVRHGITEFQGKGVYSQKDKTMLYMVVNSFEIRPVVKAIKDADAKAFIEIASVDRIEGNYRQKPLD